MNIKPEVVSRLRLHLTNILGTGASQLVSSLLPAIERCSNFKVEQVFLPDQGHLSTYRFMSNETTNTVYRRWLPNSVSRFLECTVLGHKFDGKSPLFVLGDIPLPCRGPQTVFVQTPHIIRPIENLKPTFELKYMILRGVFKLNQNRARSFIVQTDVMRQELERSYPKVNGKVHVIPQPVPNWLLKSGLVRREREASASRKLCLIYPAAGYKHKNHALLSRITPDIEWNIDSLILTLESASNPAPKIPWVRCVGFLAPEEMINLYSKADALLFLSKKESYGFPLIEAMFIGLPIICPDLPYARTLCKDQAIYFDPDEPGSLHQAVAKLRKNFDEGWWPNWQNCLTNIPADWDAVARRVLTVVCGEELDVVES